MCIRDSAHTHTFTHTRTHTHTHTHTHTPENFIHGNKTKTIKMWSIIHSINMKNSLSSLEKTSLTTKSRLPWHTDAFRSVKGGGGERRRKNASKYHYNVAFTRLEQRSKQRRQKGGYEYKFCGSQETPDLAISLVNNFHSSLLMIPCYFSATCTGTSQAFMPSCT